VGGSGKEIQKCKAENGQPNRSFYNQFLVISRFDIEHFQTVTVSVVNLLQKSVVAILDQMVNPHWPHLPKRKENYDNQEEEEGIEGAWNTIPDDPLYYYFYYQILDGDEAGQPPKIMTSEGNKLTDNEYFRWWETSCLHLIAKSNNEVR